MTRSLPPAPPDHLPDMPEFPRASRYQRPRRIISWWGLFIGLAIGLSMGLIYAWVVAPVQEYDTAPRQLRGADKAYWAVAIALEFAYDSNLGRAIDSLIRLELGPDPLQAAANAACDLARSGYVDSSAGLRGVRALMTFYQLQGRSGCADVLIPEVSEPQIVEIVVPTATATLPPPPSKTPEPGDQPVSPTPPGIAIVPTTPPRRDFEGRIAGTFCSSGPGGIIEVFVQDFNGNGIPGQRVRVRWDDGEDRFVTGLKPERGPAYADFDTEAGRGYTIDMPGRSDPIATPLVADRCVLDNGGDGITSYRVIFRRIG